MAEPFLGQIILFAGNFAIRGFAFCDGQLLPINQNQALFSLLGTTYGGDGRTTFALPDLRGRVPVHMGQGPGLSHRQLGQKGGSEAETLATTQMPAHSHSVASRVNVSSGIADRESPKETVLASNPPGSGWTYTAATPDAQMAPAAVDTKVHNEGGGQSHNNMPPYQVVSFQIALQGIFPSRT